MMSVYRLPHGQYGYSGHVVNLPQDVASFVNTLPRQPSSLDIIVVRKESSTNSHHDFRVRRSKIVNALQWLLANNKYFQNITVDSNVISNLPEDDDFTHIHTVTVSAEVPDDVESMIQETDPYNTNLSRTFVPGLYRTLTEQENVQQSLHQSTSTLMWPNRGSSPVNEFTSEGYFSCSFPTLFPTGAAEFLGARINNVTIGNYFKHLLLYDDGRFAKHCRFRYFALNTEMRWRALQTGRVYVRQNLEDAHLSVEQLRDMIGREGERFSNRVLYYAASLRGTRQYWLRQRRNLIAMIDTLDIPTIFFTHSAADLQWPDLAQLIPSSSNQSQTVIENPAIADWYFYHRVQQFIQLFYVDILGVTDYWIRFEWQHRGSPHIHGLAWLPNAPDVERILSVPGVNSTPDKEELIKFIDTLVSTSNPAVLPDGSNLDSAPPPKVNPHICSIPYSEVQDHQQDLVDLVATCQRHTRCSTNYCLRRKQGQQVCRFGYPKSIQSDTVIIAEGEQPELLTARNDTLVNSYNPIQLSAWRANVDMKYVISKQKVIEYCAKYATKTECRSQPLREVFERIVNSLKDGNTSLTAVQKLLMNSVGERDYSAQETCHLLLQLPMFNASREFVVLSLDGSRMVEQNFHRLLDEQPATTLTILDHYMQRPSNSAFNDITLLDFARNYSMPKQLLTEPTCRRKQVIVVIRPYYPPDCDGPNYEQFCQQKLMLNVKFRRIAELLGDHPTYAEAYTEFSQSAHTQSSLQDDIHRLEEDHFSSDDEDTEVSYVVFCNNLYSIMCVML